MRAVKSIPPSIVGSRKRDFDETVEQLSRSYGGVSAYGC